MSFADNFIFAEFLLFCFRNNVYNFSELLSFQKKAKWYFGILTKKIGDNSVQNNEASKATY